MPVDYLSGGFLLKCRGGYSHSFLAALFQFGGKEVLQWAIPAVLERGSAPRVSDGEQRSAPAWKTLGGVSLGPEVLLGSGRCCLSLQGLVVEMLR